MRAEAEVAEAVSEPQTFQTAQAGLILRLDYWTQAKVDLLKRTVALQGCSDDEFALFLEQCKRTGLNPFLKQAYMIERKSNVQVSGRWQEVKRFEFMAAEIGMAARAAMFPDWRGMKGASVYSKDDILVDADGGSVAHKFRPNQDRGSLVGAWAHARCEGRDVPITYLKLESRMQVTKDGRPTKFWATMPEGQIFKCARAEQYRLAYPTIFSGVYIREEMPEGDSVAAAELNPGPPQPTPAATPKARKSRTQAVTEKLKQKSRGADAGQLTTLGVGKRAGQVIAELSEDELQAAIRERLSWLPKNSKHSDAPALTLELAALQAEDRRRHTAPAEPAAPEPDPFEASEPLEPGSDVDEVPAHG